MFWSVMHSRSIHSLFKSSTVLFLFFFPGKIIFYFTRKIWSLPISAEMIRHIFEDYYRNTFSPTMVVTRTSRGFFQDMCSVQNVPGIADGKSSGGHKSGNGKSGSCVLVAGSFTVCCLLSMFLVSK